MDFSCSFLLGNNIDEKVWQKGFWVSLSEVNELIEVYLFIDHSAFARIIEFKNAGKGVLAAQLREHLKDGLIGRLIFRR